MVLEPHPSHIALQPGRDTAYVQVRRASCDYGCGSANTGAGGVEPAGTGAAGVELGEGVESASAGAASSPKPARPTTMAPTTPKRIRIELPSVRIPVRDGPKRTAFHTHTPPALIGLR